MSSPGHPKTSVRRRPVTHRKKAQPVPLRDLVLKVYPSKEPDDVRAVRAFVWWEKAVPERVAQNARPVKLERGVLFVHAATNVWASELDFLKEDLLARLHRVAPRDQIRKVVVRVGKLPPRPEVPQPRKRRPSVPVTSLPDDVARALASVADDSLRQAIGGAASLSLGRQALERPRANPSDES